MIRPVILASLLCACTMSCQDKVNKQSTAKQSTTKLPNPSSEKIAYVEVDSLMSQYQFCKDYTLILTKKGESMRVTLSNKGKALQQAAEDFQRKLQESAYTQEQAQQVQANLQKQQADLQSLQEHLSNQFDEEQLKYNNELRDSIQSFLRDYNKTHGYALIISKVGDNILLANKSLDITKDVIAGLNKRYKAKKDASKSK